MSNVQWDGEMDDWYSDGYAAQAEALRTAKYRVVFDVEYDPHEIDPLEGWDFVADLTTMLKDPAQNLVITAATFARQEDAADIIRNAQADAWNLGVAQAAEYIEGSPLLSNPFLPHISTYPDPA
jgi:hypothetical protein